MFYFGWTRPFEIEPEKAVTADVFL